MKCDEAEVLISALVDEELAGVEREAVEQHLRACAACRATLDSYQAVGDVFRERAAASPPAASPEISGAVGTRIVFPVAARVAALLALLVGIVLFLAPFGRQAPEEAPGAFEVTVTDLETDLPDATLVVYKDLETDWLIILVDSPAGDTG